MPVLVNTHAGSYASRLPVGESAVSSWVDEAPFVVRVSAGDMFNEARRLIDAGHMRVAVVGGDGTLSSVLPAFLESGAELVALPGGTLNHFCRDIGVSQNPDDWNGLLHSRCTKRVDVGSVNGHYFLNNASIGLYPKLVRLRDQLDGDRLLGSKRLATAWAVIRLWSMTRRSMKLQWRVCDGDSSHHGSMRTHVAVVSNNSYASEPMAPTSRSKLDEGRLTMYAPETLRLSSVLKLAEAALSAELDACADLVTANGRKMTLDLGRKRIRLSLDGELMILDNPLVFEIYENGLPVVISDTAQGI